MAFRSVLDIQASELLHMQISEIELIITLENTLNVDGKLERNNWKTEM